MRTKHNDQFKFKTLGPQAARFVATLHDRGCRVFTLDQAIRICDAKPASVRRFITKLVARGIATRLKPGLFVLVPFELGHAREYMGNPYVIARELAGGRDYYLSHATAMDIHQMVTQPQLVVYVTTLRPFRPRDVLGTEFRSVRSKPEDFFGVTEHWVDKQEKVFVSDLERTVIDGLKQPEYCGGVSEVAKGLWMRRQDINSNRLANYALRLDIGAVIRRLGYLMELYQIGGRDEVERLRADLTATYLLLDPVLPPEGKFHKRWRLRLNVTPEELRTVPGT